MKMRRRKRKTVLIQGVDHSHSLNTNRVDKTVEILLERHTIASGIVTHVPRPLLQSKRKPTPLMKISTGQEEHPDKSSSIRASIVEHMIKDESCLERDRRVPSYSLDG